MVYQSAILPILAQIPRSPLEAIRGNMLGAGSLQYDNRTSDGKGSGNARYAMTMAASALNYLTMLCETVYAAFKPSKLHPYPNP